MKRTFRFAIILITVAIIVAAIGFWRHHYLKTLNSEPVTIYKDTPIEPDISSKNTVVKKGKADRGTPSETELLPKDTSVNSDNADIEVETSETAQSIDNSLTSEVMDDTSNLTIHHIFSDIVVENLPPKAVEALKDYEEVQLAIPKLNEELLPLLNAIPIDFEAIDRINDKKQVLKERSMNALEILSKYSNEALAKLQSTIKRGKAAERVVEELDEDPDMTIQDIKRRMEELTK